MPTRKTEPPVRQLVLVLGDQLDVDSAAFDGFDAQQDAVWMAEVDLEATHVRCHKLRIAAFFSAMRHFRDELVGRGWRVDYHQLNADGRRDSGPDFPAVLAAAARRLNPRALVVLEPGDWRVRQSLQQSADDLGLPLEVRSDRHFFDTIEQFGAWSEGRRTLKLEDFYRSARKRHNVLMTRDGTPIGGAWNFDKQNRKSFGKSGPIEAKAPRSFRPDSVTQEVIELVAARYTDHPGSLENFDLPVTHKQSLAALRDFIDHRLPLFGEYQDAMWTDRPFLNHSRLSFALNLHLIDPRRCVDSAVEAYESGHAPLNSVEGFVRQILGWREFVRGVYWTKMPNYVDRNALDCDADTQVPASYWDGETEMVCVRDAMRSVLSHGYAHHIHRLMVLGLFAQLVGVHPRLFHDWHMAMYVDAIDWVSLPNTLGMSQYGDGGVVGTKPYCASGAYINRMSNYCKSCKYDPSAATGGKACPVTTLYWDFLDRHRKQFESNRRMVFQVKNLEKKEIELPEIRERAEGLRARLAAGDAL
ncbi:Deoxyribodipyrimidine photo-lyase-related protein [Pirellulimonas nuda]|uniref:Deoxyribodipyrimidine photo-lyase-related protein n=1 Tax=Pirellulimonas nuda TaxID=2528009 RepID=A0A518D7Z7_9BACT|nr:cryptochrome/photolyase family protein [Pirellulimonas nuda]QDU87584.1 Deoxyribodipyrimidine photo-lyase-related protein [Pirellulimonas nuda]